GGTRSRRDPRLGVEERLPVEAPSVGEGAGRPRRDSRSCRRGAVESGELGDGEEGGDRGVEKGRGNGEVPEHAAALGGVRGQIKGPQFREARHFSLARGCARVSEPSIGLRRRGGWSL